MKVTVLGATGLTGKLLVEKALAIGYSVTAFVRNPSKMTIENIDLRVVKGDITDIQSLKTAIKEQDAIISAIGTANPLKQNDSLTQGIRNVIKIMEEENVKRLIYMSAYGVSDSFEKLDFITKYIIAGILLRGIFADHAENEKVIKNSDLDWTIVRPVRLTNKNATGNYRHGEVIGKSLLTSVVSRSDTADFMLKQLKTDTYLKKSPAIMY